MIQLSKRLSHIAAFVPTGTSIIDVGTDHGYLPIYLRQKSEITHAIATDINKGPVENAKKHIARYGISEIEVRQGNGLSAIAKEECEVVILAGMGGYLIIDILMNALQKIQNVERLILQPQQDIDKVRRFLHANNFVIMEEDFLEEEGKYYTIIVAKPGKECYAHTYDYLYGRYLIEHPTEDFKKWLQKKTAVLQKVEANLHTVYTENAQNRLKEIQEEQRIHQEVIKCIN